ncbi:hypothetical protein C8R44DRAFT_988368, partial [Mycena epipterygia]
MTRPPKRRADASTTSRCPHHFDRNETGTPLGHNAEFEINNEPNYALSLLLSVLGRAIVRMNGFSNNGVLGGEYIRGEGCLSTTTLHPAYFVSSIYHISVIFPCLTALRILAHPTQLTPPPSTLILTNGLIRRHIHCPLRRRCHRRQHADQRSVRLRGRGSVPPRRRGLAGKLRQLLCSCLSARRLIIMHTTRTLDTLILLILSHYSRPAPYTHFPRHLSSPSPSPVECTTVYSPARILPASLSASTMFCLCTRHVLP